MKPSTFFNRYPVFTYREFARAHSATGQRSRQTTKNLLSQHVANGLLLHVRRGLYAVVPPGANPETFPVDPYLVAAKMTDDAVLAYHTALELHGKAHSVFNEFYFLSRTPPRPAEFRSQRFRGVRFPKALRTKGQEEYGIKDLDRSGVDVRSTDLERTLVDVLDRPDLTGGWEETWRSLEAVEFFDLDEVVEYALLLDNATCAAKVGYFLDQHREHLMVEDVYLKSLKKRRPKQPHYMERNSRGKGRFMSEWNLVVPRAIVERVWEEVR